MKRELAVGFLEACPHRPTSPPAVKALAPRPRRLLPRFLALLLVAAILAPPAAAAKSKGELLFDVAKFLGKQFVSYGFGKGFDYVIGKLFESEMQQYAGDLEQQLPNANGRERSQLEEELRLVKSQLATLQRVLYGELTPQEVAALQKQVQGEIPQIKRLLLEQGQRISNVEGRVSGVEGDVREMRQRLEDLELRLTMPEYANRVPVFIDAFTSGTRQLPATVIDSARDVLAGELSFHPDVSLVNQLSRLDARITGHVARYSMDERTYSGYGTRPRSTIFHTLELSLSLTDPSGERIYWTKRYRRETREFLSAGNWGTSNDFGVAHELFSHAMRAAAGDVLAFIFVEEPPPEGEEYVELDR